MLPLSSYFPIASAALERPWTPADPEGKYVVGWHVRRSGCGVAETECGNN